MINESKLSAHFEFTENGDLKAIFLNASTEKDQAILKKSLDKLLNQKGLNWIRTFFKRG